MPLITQRHRARIDMAERWEYIAENSEFQADAVVDRINAKLKLLAQRPELGRTRPELMASLRSFPFERYVIFYSQIPDGIDVVPVLHGARDIDAQFHQDT